MNTCRGITITSLIIYVIAMLIVVGIIASFTSFFYQNVTNIEDSSNNVSAITKFNMYFLQEVKNQDNAIAMQNTHSITFTSGNTFTFQDNSIYLNSNKICENIKNLEISLNEENDKTIITTLITIGENIEYTKTTSFVMK